ncbi:MAG: transposase [Candidatus Atelocyanobacterium thalassa]
MSPKKLIDDDKQEILKLYRQTAETTSTLAHRYGVSSSTISRFLKNTLSDIEYEELIQQKRLARTSKIQNNTEETKKSNYKITKLFPEFEKDDVNTCITESLSENIPNDLSAKPKPITVKHIPNLLLSLEKTEVVEEESDELENLDVVTLEEMLGEDLECNYEDWDEEDEDSSEDDKNYDESLSTNGNIRVLPLSDAILPKTCYLVIDRSAELIARPLKEFAHLGQIPVSEIQQRTLPVFDNHRFARRFSNRSQRVIKIPDSRLLYKTCSYLQAKGITRIFVDGQIYSLDIEK